MQRGNSQQKCTPVSRTHPNTFQNIATAQMHSQRSDMQYNLQHEKWDELRHKMKSMRLNKIGVTSYLDKTGKQSQGHELLRRLEQINGSGLVNERGFVKSEFKLETLQKPTTDNKSPILKDKLELDIEIGPFSTQNKFYTSKNKQKTQNKIKSIVPYTPYFSHAYQLQRIRPSTNHSKAKMASQQNPELSCNLQKKQKKVRQFALPQAVQLKMKKRRIKLQNDRKKIKTSASYYKNNKSINQKTNPPNAPTENLSHNMRTTKSKQIFTTDLVEFSQLKPEDYTQRAIIRRKSNIIGDCIQAIEASILKGKIILFTVSVTSGNANYFAEIKHLPPTDIFNDNCQKFKPASQMNSKVISHTTTGSYQMRLMIGSAQIMQYLDLFVLSHHPIQLQASIAKLGVILVDFLKITEKGLKIDKSQILSNLKNIGAQNKDLAMQQLYKQLKNNQLVRWKNTKKSANRLHHHNLIHEHNVLNHHHEPESGRHSRGSRDGEAGYYRVYGQPHPKINSKQYDMIESSQPDEMVENNQPNPQQPDKIVPNISQISSKHFKLKSEIDENISHHQTISIADQLPDNNHSKVISKSGDVVEEII